MSQLAVLDPGAGSWLGNHRQDRLVDRLHLSAPRVIHCAAPAGYGKSTLARSYAEFFPLSVTVDCTDLRDAPSFAAAVVSALERESPDRSSALAAKQYAVAAGVSLDDVRPVLDEVWSAAAEPSLFIFENVEAVADCRDIVDLLLRLAYTAPAKRSVFICSRIALQMRANRHLPPHALIIVPPQELLMSKTEARDLIAQAGGGISEDDVATIVQEARGWPILILILIRFAREGRLRSVLADTRSVAFETLHAYLMSEILEPLDTQARALLECIVAVPGAQLDELQYALGLDLAALQTRLLQIPLIEQNGESIGLHAVVREALRLTGTTASEYRLRVARFNEQRENGARAAMLFRLAGERDAAARVLSAVAQSDGGHQFSADLARELTYLDPAEIRQYPAVTRLILSTQTDVPRSIAAVALDAAASLASIDSHSQLAVLSSALGVLMIGGRFRDAKALLDRHEIRGDMIAGVRETIESRLGFPSTSQTALLQLVDTIERNQPLREINIARELSLTFRWTGNREQCMRWSRRALDLASRAEIALLPTLALFNALANAWFWSEASFSEFLELGDLSIVSRSDGGSLSRWYEWVFHNGDHGFDEPYHEAIAVHLLLMKAASSGEEEAKSLIERAERRMEQSDDIALQTIVALASAEVRKDGNSRVESFVARLEQLPELAALKQACEAYLRGSTHPLLGFLAHFASGPAAVAASEPSAVVQLLNESVTVGGREIRLVGKDLGLVAYLSKYQRGVSIEELQESLWPDLDGTSARDALYSTLYRLRKRTGSSAWIENTGNAYRLAPDVVVDTWSIESVVSQAELAQDHDLVALEAAFQAISKRNYPRLEQYEWFVPLDYKAREARRRVASILVGVAFERQDFRYAVGIGQAVLQDDACDEWAQEVTIRAMLALGDTLGAARTYRQYRELLQRELATEPSEELRALVGDAGKM